MIRLLLKKQICMEVGYMQDSVKVEIHNVIDLMDWIPEIIILLIIILMFISTIWLGFNKAQRKYWKRRGEQKWLNRRER
jgi:hypothetical protein